jgi:hypothetical protein
MSDFMQVVEEEMKNEPVAAEEYSSLGWNNGPYVDYSTPRITSTPAQNNDLFSTANLVILVFVMFIGYLFYRRRNRNDIDDEYVKESEDKEGIYESLTDPFKRKNKKDKDNAFGSSFNNMFNRNKKKDNDKDDDYDSYV